MRSLAAAPALLLVLAAAGPARAGDDKAAEKIACVAASEEAQSLRSDGKLRAAREKLLLCAKETCPAVVKKDCAEWLVEVDRSLPSIVPTVRDDSGKDISIARVTIDGKLVSERLDGRAVPMDPGAHTIKVEASGVSREEQVVLREGERNRVVVVTLVREAPPGPIPPPPARPGPPALAYVMTGVAVLGVAGFAGFGLAGRGEVDGMRDTCAPACAVGDVDAARTKLIAADVSLAVGVVAAGVATWLFLKPRDDARPPTVGVVRF